MDEIKIFYDEQEVQVYQGDELVIYIDKHTENEDIAMSLQELLTEFGIVAELHEGIADDEY